MVVRKLNSGDEEATRAFFARVPERDQRFFKEDVVGDPSIVARWLADRRSPRLVAVEDDGTLRGYAAVVPGVGWSSHVAELHVVVDPERRREGIGGRLVWKALDLTRELRLEKLVVEVVAEQEEAVAMFQVLGFQPEAVLPGHVRDRDGVTHDLILLANTGALALGYQTADA